MTERRYSEAEVAAIFERAATMQPASVQQSTPATGMTLAQLKEIGREVGIAPDVIEHAATAIEHVSRDTSESFVGFPLRVGRTVELPRRLTDDEWERLVVDLRNTFDARGNVRQEGSLRQWTNGNLQVFLEPGTHGHRLRLRTLRQLSRSLMLGGLGVGALSAFFLVFTTLAGGPEMGKVAAAGMIAAVGALVFGAGALPLLSWARTRAQQMKEIAERAVETASRPPRE